MTDNENLNKQFTENYNRFVVADECWMLLLAKICNGRRLGDVRYTKEAEGLPGSALNLAYIEFCEARDEFHRLSELKRAIAKQEGSHATP